MNWTELNHVNQTALEPQRFFYGWKVNTINTTEVYMQYVITASPQYSMAFFYIYITLWSATHEWATGNNEENGSSGVSHTMSF